MIAEKIKSSFGFFTDAVRCTLSLVNRQFSLPIDFNALVKSRIRYNEEVSVNSLPLFYGPPSIFVNPGPAKG